MCQTQRSVIEIQSEQVTLPVFKALSTQYRKISKYMNMKSYFHTVKGLLTRVLVLSQLIEINQSLEKKSRQGFIGASAVAWENENNQLRKQGVELVP